MALNCDIDNGYAEIGITHSGGGATFAFWVRKTGTFNRELARLRDTDAGTSAAVRAETNPAYTAVLVSTSGSSVTSTGANQTSDTWQHYACVLSGSAGSVTATVYVNGTAGTTTAARSVSTALDAFRIGVNSTNESDAHFAHAAYWDTELTPEQITALQTTLPTGVGTPQVYKSFLTDTTGWTVNAASISSTYDSSIPTLGEGGGSASNTRNSGRLMLGIG